MNTAEFLQITSMVVPDRTALVSGEKRVTFMEMADRVNRLANWLQSIGAGPDHPVGAVSTNGVEYVETYYAAAKIGATFVPLNYRAKHEELTYMINTSDVHVLFVGERYLDLVSTLRPTLTNVKHFACYDKAVDGMGHLTEILGAASADEPFVDVDESRPTVLIYTSGTTSQPKGVALSYLNLSVYVTNTMSPADPSEEPEVTLLSVPIFHVAGVTPIMSSVWGGRTLVILPQFDPELWLKAVQSERVTHSFVVPTMLKRIMEHPEFHTYDLSSLKLITYGAAPMPYEVVSKAVDAFSCGLMNAYGQTESTSTMTFLGPEDHNIPKEPGPEREKKLHRLRSVGRGMDDIVIAIMDEQNAVLDAGVEGEICVQGPRIMSQYYKQAEATAAAIHDGWLHTGDLGYLDDEGYLFITGRKKDLIIRGGENISTGEIEATLDEHPQIAESAVIGVPDVEWGEVIKAIIVPEPGQKPDPAELTKYVKEKLASYKAPAYYAFVEELPMNPMGKVLKTELRKLYGKAGERVNVSGVRTAVEAMADAVVAVRRDLHEHAELSTEERRTQALILERLSQLGLDDVRECADTGATGIVRGAKPGPNLLWRADIDALPLMEETGLPFASREKAMHACGHDGHVAIALAMAEVVQRSRDALAGSLRFAFQPAEEHVGGARRMIEDGVMAAPKVDRAFGLHIWAPVAVGDVRVAPGPVFAAATHLRIVIRGRGGHASAPHQTIDPIVVAAQAIVALQTVVSRAVDPEHTAVFTIGRIEGGVRGNIIPNEVMMSGTIRTFEASVLERVLARVDEILRGVTSAFGAEYQFDTSTLRAVVNDAECAAMVAGVASALLGPEHVGEARTTGGDDMAYFLEAAPGAYFMLGGGNASRGITWPHHHPRFDFDEACLPIGVELGLRIIEEASGSRL